MVADALSQKTVSLNGILKSLPPELQEEIAQLYVSRIVSLHGLPRTITSDQGSLFTSAFWSRLHQALGTALKYSTAYHPQTDGQTER